jgi:hypothetical protein
MKETAPALVGDALDWLHEQGKRRSEAVPEFDVEETLCALRAVRTTSQDQDEPAAGSSSDRSAFEPSHVGRSHDQKPSVAQRQSISQRQQDIQELIDKLEAVTKQLRNPGHGGS